MIIKLVIFFIYKSAKRKLNQTLDSSFSKNEISLLKSEVWNEYLKRRKDLQKQKTLGANMMLHLSLLTHATYLQLIKRNIPEKEAMRTTAKITWNIYQKTLNPYWKIASVFGKDPVKRLNKIMKFCINYFPFQQPGYEILLDQNKKEQVAFNVHKCPAATYFKEHQLAKLCIESWCNIDYPLAKKWDLELHRTTTLSAGGNCCDFVFKYNEKQQQ